MVGILIHRKTDNTIIKKTSNGRQPNTQKNRKFNYKKRQTMVGNLIHRKTDNTIIKKTNNGWQPNTQKNRQYN
jgi:hypothetical protein